MTQCKYRQYFNSRSAPKAFMIRSLVSRFEELGSVADRPGRGANRNIRTEDNVETVRQSVVDDPSVSTCRHSSQFGISRTTLRRSLKLDLKIHLYKICMGELCKHWYRKTTCCVKFLAYLKFPLTTSFTRFNCTRLFFMGGDI
ncbi:hypothetical protein TNCV_4534661 [Trichonephila clavipes]|nr:hypothetical protein TNCV_4534661 [Trichonephila clavipes]